MSRIVKYTAVNQSWRSHYAKGEAETHLQQLQNIVSDVKVGKFGIQDLEVDILRRQAVDQ